MWLHPLRHPTGDNSYRRGISRRQAWWRHRPSKYTKLLWLSRSDYCVCVCAHSSSCRQEGHTLLILHPERSHYRTANQQSSIATPHQQLFKQAQEHWLITPELSFSLKDAPFFFLGLLLDGFFLLRLLRLFDPSETATLLMLPLSKSLSTSGSSSSLCAHGTKDFKIRLGYNRVPSA